MPHLHKALPLGDILKKTTENKNKETMNKIIYFLLLIISQSVFGQDNVVKKPENVIIINNEISSMEKVENLVTKDILRQ